MTEITAAERVAPVGLPAGNEVESLVELCQQSRYLPWIVLEVGVDGHDDFALGVREPGREGGRLAEISSQADDPHVVSCVM